MPANLTPQYSKAEDAYRKAQTADERLACLESMLQLIPKHKGTEKLQADLKSKIKEARGDVEVEKKSPKKGAKSTRIPRQGAGQIIVLGAPNAGKSRLIAELTSATPTVAPYPFTTRETLAAMMPFEDVSVQLVDTPPITSSHFEPELLGLVRSADAVLLCFDGSSDDAPDQTLEVITMLHERRTRLSNQSGFAEDDYSVVHIKTALVATRSDDPGAPDRLTYWNEMTSSELLVWQVEFDRAESTNELRSKVFELLDVMRIYTKAPGKPLDNTAPFTLPRDSTVSDLAGKIHRDLPDKVRHARVWTLGAGDPRTVGAQHPLSDGDLVELHTS